MARRGPRVFLLSLVSLVQSHGRQPGYRRVSAASAVHRQGAQDPRLLGRNENGEMRMGMTSPHRARRSSNGADQGACCPKARWGGGGGLELILLQVEALRGAGLFLVSLFISRQGVWGPCFKITCTRGLAIQTGRLQRQHSFASRTEPRPRRHARRITERYSAIVLASRENRAMDEVYYIACHLIPIVPPAAPHPSAQSIRHATLSRRICCPRWSNQTKLSKTHDGRLRLRLVRWRR